VKESGGKNKKKQEKKEYKQWKRSRYICLCVFQNVLKQDSLDLLNSKLKKKKKRFESYKDECVLRQVTHVKKNEL